MNISLDEDQLLNLLSGGVVTVNTVQIALSDIGSDRIIQIAVEAKQAAKDKRFTDHLDYATKTVAKWPPWKKGLL